METIIQYIEALRGPHFNITLFSGDIQIRKFNKSFRQHVITYYGDSVKFEYLWFCTDEGVILTVSGDRPALDALPAFIESMQGETFNTFEVLHTSHGMKGYIRALRKAFRKYQPCGTGRSYGASQ